MLINLTKDNYVRVVEENDKKVLIDFYASWCGPCKMLAPIIDAIANEHPNIEVCKVNVDEQRALAEKFNVMSVPTVFILERGKIVNQFAGYRTKADIIKYL